MAGTDITVDFVRSVLDYDPDTGIFRWKRNRSGVSAGKMAGCIRSDGYRVIGLQETYFYAHRLAWLYVYGKWPPDQVDHLNGNRCDNRIANLREADYSINAQNRRSSRPRSKLGILGVCICQGHYKAQIMINGVNKNLGRFNTVHEASAAYIKAKRAIHRGNTL